MERLCSTLMLLTLPACECSAVLHGSESVLSSPQMLHLLLVFLHRGPVSGHTEGVWTWAGPNLSDPQGDLLLLWLLTVHY
jgi:hypothetical protein